jgi:hypothetical protein
MKKETGGPAFPHGMAFQGMTLRDYFAAQAMQGLGSQLSIYSVTVDEVAELSYRQADAMLKEREK